MISAIEYMEKKCLSMLKGGARNLDFLTAERKLLTLQIMNAIKENNNLLILWEYLLIEDE